MSFISDYRKARKKKKQADKYIEAAKAEIGRQQKARSIMQRGGPVGMQEGSVTEYAKQRARSRRGNKNWWR